MNDKNRYEYYAFISYVPKDEKFVKWLQKNMESFRLSAFIQHLDRTISDRIGQFFIEKEESNTATSVEVIRPELFVSKYLLVICTPAAAQSKIVNEDVRVFLTNGRKDDIILVMVSGEPDASDPQNECLPVDIRELAKEERPVSRDFRTGNRKKSILSLVAYLIQMPETSLLQYNKKGKTLWRVVWYSLVVISILIGAFIWEYNRVRYEYYVSYVDRWGIPEGIDSLTPEQASLGSRFFRFEYRHIPITEGNPSEWRLECVSCVNGYGQLDVPQPMAYLPQERDCSVCKLDYLHGKIYSLSYYNTDNQLVSVCKPLDYEGQPQGWVDRRFHRGAEGNMMEDGSVDASGLLQIPCIKVDRDDDGYIQRISYHANNDRDVRSSAVCDESYAYAYDIYRDKKHRLVKIVTLSKEMKPIDNKQGITSINFVYDETNGRIIEVSYKDKFNNYVDGFTYLRYRYDENGNFVEARFYNKDRTPCLVCESGISVKRYIRDEHGAIKECRYFDQASNPMNSKQGVASILYVRDSYGNAVGRSFYDEKGNLTLTENGYAIDKTKYNENNKIVEWTFYGVDEKPILNRKGYACVRYTYDDQNRVVSESYFDETDMPIEANKVKGARVEYVYGDDGLLASESYYDVNGQPYVGHHGMKVVYKYDDRGNRIEKTFYDEHDNLFVGVDRVAQFRYWYDDLGIQTEARCYGLDGELTMSRRNVSIFRSEHDSLNRITYFAFYDKENRPCVNYSRQCALIKQIFESDQNKSVTTIKYNWNGKDYVEKSRTQVQKDIYGNTICSKNLNSHGQCCLNSEGLASWTAKYDQRGNRIECNYWGIDNIPVNIKDYNFASWKASYDHKDRRIEQSYYDIHGNLTVNNRGVARWKAVYKDNGNTPYMYYYDLEGNVISNDEK